MAARAIWKGVIRLDGFRLPVKLYSAVVDRTIHFHLLHEADGVRVRQRLVDPETGDTLSYQDAQRGFEVESGVFVILNEEELAEAEPDATRDIHVECLVAVKTLQHPWYDRPYYLGPDGDDHAYFALGAALEKEQLEGIARWTFRRKEYVGALRCEEGVLMLITLRHQGEVIPPSDLEPPTGRAFDGKERDMAEKLLHTLDDDFQPDAFHDEHRQRVLDLIEAKRKGEKPELKPPEPARKEPESLADVLEASLAAAR